MIEFLVGGIILTAILITFWGLIKLTSRKFKDSSTPMLSAFELILQIFLAVILIGATAFMFTIGAFAIGDAILN